MLIGSVVIGGAFVLHHAGDVVLQVSKGSFFEGAVIYKANVPRPHVALILQSQIKGDTGFGYSIGFSVSFGWTALCLRPTLIQCN